MMENSLKNIVKKVIGNRIDVQLKDVAECINSEEFTKIKKEK